MTQDRSWAQIRYTGSRRPGYAGPRARATACGPARTPTKAVRSTKSKANLPVEAVAIPLPITHGTWFRGSTPRRYAARHRTHSPDTSTLVQSLIVDGYCRLTAAVTATPAYRRKPQRPEVEVRLPTVVSGLADDCAK